MIAAAPVVLALTLVALAEEDAGAPDELDAGSAEVEAPPSRYDGGVIDFFPDGGAGLAEPKWLHLFGNRVLPDEAYRRELKLPPDAVPDEPTAVAIAQTLEEFLHAAGYELATVEAHAIDGNVDVKIDEGRLEKIVTRGRFTWQTLRFRVALFIDQDVFNRPAMERQVEKLSKDIGIRVIRWALVPTPNPKHYGPQIGAAPEIIANIEGYELFHERRHYELHFFFEEHDWDTGFSTDIRSGYLDGFEIIAAYHGAHLFAEGDRWRVAASAGAGIRNKIYPESGFYPAFSRAFAEARYYAPKFAGRVRPYVWATGTLIGRARADLGLDNYNEASAIASAHVAVDLTKFLKGALGVGVQWRRIFNLEWTPTADQTVVQVSERLRSFIELRFEMLFDPENDRNDRTHRFDFGGRYYFGQAVGMESGTRQYGWVYERYQKSFALGWHDLILKSQGRAAFGDVQFHDEDNVAGHLRGVFGDTYIRKGVSLSGEFRFSLIREIFKLSLFADTALWGQVNRTVVPNKETAAFGVAFGPGIHFLIQGIFQLDIYASFGLQPSGKNAIAGLLILNKVF